VHCRANCELSSLDVFWNNLRKIKKPNQRLYIIIIYYKHYNSNNNNIKNCSKNKILLYTHVGMYGYEMLCLNAKNCKGFGRYVKWVVSDRVSLQKTTEYESPARSPWHDDSGFLSSLRVRQGGGDGRRWEKSSHFCALLNRRHETETPSVRGVTFWDFYNIILYWAYNKIYSIIHSQKTRMTPSDTPTDHDVYR